METKEISRDRGLTMLWLTCGTLSSLWYVAINIIVPTQYDGYSMISLTVSELSAIGAPTRNLWISVVIIYPFLFAAFGRGVWKAARQNKLLRVVGALIIFYSVFNIYWPPMHQRGTVTSLTDGLHIVWASVTVLLMIVIMVLSAVAMNKWFRIYTIISIVLHILFGILTSVEAPNIPINGPTPWIGLWERINIGIFMLWIIVFAALLRKNFLSEIKRQA